MTTAYHHGDLQLALVQAAMAQVAAQGAENVSLRGLAAEVGVSPSAVYHHFADKRSLMDQVCMSTAELLGHDMQSALNEISGDSDEDALSRFRKLGEAYISFALTHRHLFLATFGTTHALVEESRGTPFQLLVKTLDELESKDLLRPGTRHGLELVAWSQVHGLAMLLLDGHLKEHEIETTLETMRKLVVA